jgi:hypothetical protein
MQVQGVVSPNADSSLVQLKCLQLYLPGRTQTLAGFERTTRMHTSLSPAGWHTPGLPESAQLRGKSNLLEISTCRT